MDEFEARLLGLRPKVQTNIPAMPDVLQRGKHRRENRRRRALAGATLGLAILASAVTAGTVLTRPSNDATVRASTPTEPPEPGSGVGDTTTTVPDERNPRAWTDAISQSPGVQAPDVTELSFDELVQTSTLISLGELVDVQSLEVRETNDWAPGTFTHRVLRLRVNLDAEYQGGRFGGGLDRFGSETFIDITIESGAAKPTASAEWTVDMDRLARMAPIGQRVILFASQGNIEPVNPLRVRIEDFDGGSLRLCQCADSRDLGHTFDEQLLLIDSLPRAG